MRPALTCLALGALLLTGCTDDQEAAVPEPTAPRTTLAQVRERVPALVDEAVALFDAAPADVQLGEPLEDACDGSLSPSPGADVRLTRDVFVTAAAGDAAARVARVADLLAARGWSRTVQPSGRVVLDAGQGYAVVLGAPSADRVVVTGVSPCAAPEG